MSIREHPHAARSGECVLRVVSWVLMPSVLLPIPIDTTWAGYLSAEGHVVAPGNHGPDVEGVGLPLAPRIDGRLGALIEHLQNAHELLGLGLVDLEVGG